MNSSEYQLTIKSANQKVDDYVAQCSSTWNVYRLKQHISETHINRPRIEDQRLIYAGTLLKDSWFLKQIFFRDSLCTELTNSSKTDFTIHLVCYTPPSKTSASSSSTVSNTNPPQTSNTGGQSNSGNTARPTSSTNLSNRSTIQAQGNVDRVQPANTPSPVPTNSQNYNHDQHQAPIDRNNPATPSNNSNQTTIFTSTQHVEMIQNYMQSEQMRQQMAIFQQLAYVVAAQIANNVTNSRNLAPINYDQASQSPIMTPAFDFQALNVQTTASQNNNFIAATSSQLLYAGNRQQTHFVRADASGGVHPNENMNDENNDNAPGVVGEPAEPQLRFEQVHGRLRELVAPPPDPQGLQHDVIDWIYYSTRAIILMGALYLHATWFRLLFIITLLAMAYAFNRRRFPPRQEQPQQVQPRNHAPAFQPPDQTEVRRRNTNGEELPQTQGANEADELVQGRIQEEAAPGRIPFLKLCYLVVTDFLASLVPE